MRTEIPFLHYAVLVDDERHDSRIPIDRWIREQAKTSGHVSVDKKTFRAAGRVRSLALEDPVVVTMVGLRFFVRHIGGIAAGARLGHQRTERALGLAGAGRPVKPIVLAFVTHEVLCEFGVALGA